jgi:hypothetical protein
LISITVLRELQKRFAPGKLNVITESDMSSELNSSSVTILKEYSNLLFASDSDLKEYSLASGLHNGRSCLLKYFDIPHDFESHIGILTHLSILKTFQSNGQIEQFSSVGIVRFPAFNYEPKVSILQ